ncbi:hypothetical protein V8C44DRAFT_60521 [Trichoderma aethiopicum]
MQRVVLRSKGDFAVVDFTGKILPEIGTVRGTNYLANPLGARASGVFGKAKSCPVLFRLSNHKAWTAIRPPATVLCQVLERGANPLLLGCHAVLSIHITQITLDTYLTYPWGVWYRYFPESRSRHDGSLPRTKVPSSVGGVSSWWFLAERLVDDVDFCITKWHGNHVKRNLCRK